MARKTNDKFVYPTEEEWRTRARQALKEQDPEKLVALAQQIVPVTRGNND